MNFYSFDSPNAQKRILQNATSLFFLIWSQHLPRSAFFNWLIGAACLLKQSPAVYVKCRNKTQNTRQKNLSVIHAKCIKATWDCLTLRHVRPLNRPLLNSYTVGHRGFNWQSMIFGNRNIYTRNDRYVHVSKGRQWRIIRVGS